MQGSRCGGEFAGHALQAAQQSQGTGLAFPVAGLAGRGKGGLLEGLGVIPVAPQVKEVGHGSGDQRGVPGPAGGGGMDGDRVQVGAFGLEPGCCLLRGGEPGRAVRLPGCGQRADRDHQGRPEFPVGGQRGVQVVVQQPVGGRVAGGGILGGGQGPGMVAEQVMQPVAAGGRLE